MIISSRTPEGSGNRCTICGRLSWMEPSLPTNDATCPHCGSLLWYQDHAVAADPRHEEVHVSALGDTSRLDDFVRRAMVHCDGRRGALWLLQPPLPSQILTQINAAAEQFTSIDEWRRHEELLAAAAREDSPVGVPPRYRNGAVTANPTDSLLFLLPLRRDDELTLVLEIFADPTLPMDRRDHCLESLAAFCRGWFPEEAQHAEWFVGPPIAIPRIKPRGLWNWIVAKFSRTAAEKEAVGTR